jgi:serralysin
MAIRNGTAGNDTLIGTSLDDFFNGGDGDDIMYGQNGNDTFYANAGADLMIGGSGSDTVDYSAISEQPSWFGITGVYVDLEGGFGAEVGGPGLDSYSSIENVTGSNYVDAIRGDGNNNRLRGLGGDDFIEGGDGADTMEGGSGSDWLAYRDSDARVVIDLLANTASGGDATGDVISSFENVIGSDFGDRLSGTNGANTIEGGAGNDVINGRGGDDTIWSGDGNDLLTGGSGFDTFVYREDFYSGGTDRIMDFDVDRDTIQFDVDDNGGNVSMSITNYDVFSMTADVVISLANTGTVILENISLGDLNSVAGQIEIV